MRMSKEIILQLISENDLKKISGNYYINEVEEFIYFVCLLFPTKSNDRFIYIGQFDKNNRDINKVYTYVIQLPYYHHLKSFQNRMTLFENYFNTNLNFEQFIEFALSTFVYIPEIKETENNGNNENYSLSIFDVLKKYNTIQYERFKLKYGI